MRNISVTPHLGLETFGAIAAHAKRVTPLLLAVLPTRGTSPAATARYVQTKAVNKENRCHDGYHGNKEGDSRKS